MTRDNLIKKIAEQLKEQKIKHGYNFEIEWQLKDVLKPFLKEDVFKNLSVEKLNRYNTFYIRYKNFYLFSINYTKTKGESHLRTFEDYTDYYYKDFTCGDQNEDFDIQRKLYEIEISIIDREENRQKEFNKMLDCYNQIKTLFGEKTNDVLRYIERNKSKLERGTLNY